MASSSSPAAAAPTVQADDLKQIHGIGPGIEARLNAAGIFNYAQLAAMSPDEVVLALGNVVGLTVKRVIDQDWVGQAGKLAPQLRPSASANGKAGRQHYATFAIELLLDENNNVRRTHAVNIQSEAEDTWAGWDEHRLLEFMAHKAGLSFEERETAAPPAVTPAPVSLVKLAGQPQLSSMMVKAVDAGRPSRILPEFKAFEIETMLDLSDLVVPPDARLAYSATINAKAFGERPEQRIGEARGVFETVQAEKFSVSCSGLKEGTYRLHINLSLNLPAPEGEAHSPLTTILDGGLVKIY